MNIYGKFSGIWTTLSEDTESYNILFQISASLYIPLKKHILFSETFTSVGGFGSTMANIEEVTKVSKSILSRILQSKEKNMTKILSIRPDISIMRT